ncbi:MAG TPA: hypothetical protein VND89_03045 [Acidimicrobiales bacterium]|nr:hypothetical protein [Acidimicrobiales bacterium]
MTASIRNTSSSTCGVEIGGTSPFYTVTNSSGVVVWSGCSSGDEPSKCPEYLMDKELSPNQVYAKTVTWDQRAGAPLTRVPTGTYTFSTQFDGVTKPASSKFALTLVSTAKTFIATRADNSRNYSLHRGDRLIVRLSGPSIYTWSAAVASNPAILRRTSNTAGATSIAIFVAEDSGHAQITATGNPICYPGCLVPSQLFSIRVSVVA